jgi:hypothetical protein
LEIGCGAALNQCMTDIFLSYAHQDRECAKRLAGAFADHGWEVWWDRDIDVGSCFSEVIQREIDQARCIVVLWSSSSLMSGWVQDEASEAARRRILVPVCIEDVRPPLGFRHLQTAELFDWPRGLEGPAFEQCLEGIENFAPRSAPKKQDPSEDISPAPAAAQPFPAGAHPPEPARRKPRRIARAAWIFAAILVGLIFIFGMMADNHDQSTMTGTNVPAITAATTSAATTSTASTETAVPAAKTDTGGADTNAHPVAISLQNCSDQAIEVAIAYRGPSKRWMSQGWYSVPPKSTSSNVLTVYGQSVYFYGYSDGDVQFEGDDGEEIRKAGHVDFKNDFSGGINQIKGEDVRAVSFFGRNVDPARDTYTQDFDCK